MQKIIIQMLGEFSISFGDKCIDEKSRRSKKMWTLLKYLITFRDREISQNEIIDLLWPNGESDNPGGALKTQLYRLRMVLKELGIPDEKELVISVMGTYAFNNTLDTTIDIVEFERYFKLSSQAEISEKEQASYLQKAFRLYKGDFLHKSGIEKWIIPINVYYHSVFLKIAHRFIDILHKHKQYTELIDVCKKTVLIDNLDNKAHHYLIKALYESGEHQAAKRHYYYVIDMFYNQQGINPSPELISLYHKIIKADECYETDLEMVKQRLNEKDEYAEKKQRGAFFCEYEFFKHVYRLELRDAERTGRKFCICLLSAKDSGGEIPESCVLGKTMQLLFESISKSLRASDVFSRYSASQFIMMLPVKENDNVELIIKRVIKKFHRDNPRSRIELESCHGMAQLTTDMDV